MATNSPIARRLPGFDARHATHRARGLGRGLVVVVVVAAVAAGGAIAAVMLRSSGGPKASTVTSTSAAATLAAGVAPWTLKAPVDSEVVLVPPASGGGAGGTTGSLLEVFGGSTTGEQPASGIFTLDVSNGTLVHVANLTTVLADAAGAVIGGQAMVLGGATPTPIATVQAAPATGSGTAARVTTATVVGSLPEPRSGAATATVGTTTYVVGGENGPLSPDPTVLATTDGRSFSDIATLPVPVSFPAVAAIGAKLFVFGGEAVSGNTAGQPVTTVQLVDVTKHRAKVIGRMPVALEGAAAVTVGGKVLLVGGDSFPSTTTSYSSSAASSGAAGGVNATGSQTSATVWDFDPLRTRFVSAGRLQTPVARAGVAVLGSTVWLVGGSSAGAPVSVVQSLSLSAAPSHPG